MWRVWIISGQMCGLEVVSVIHFMHEHWLCHAHALQLLIPKQCSHPFLPLGIEPVRVSICRKGRGGGSGYFCMCDLNDVWCVNDVNEE